MKTDIENNSVELFEEVECVNCRPDANYTYKIKWNVDKISNQINANGYIVQKVILKDEIKIISNYNSPYYEAWQVIDGKIVGNNNTFDDNFELGMNSFSKGLVLFNSIGYKGDIIYKTEIYWIDVNNYLYNEINKWKENEVSMSNGLKAIYVKDCDLLKNEKPVGYRCFSHNVNFIDTEVIKKYIYITFEQYFINKDKTLKDELLNYLDNKKYENLIIDLLKENDCI